MEELSLQHYGPEYVTGIRSGQNWGDGIIETRSVGAGWDVSPNPLLSLSGIWSLTYEEEYTCPLYVTASRGYSDCLQLLLKKGAEVDFSPSGESALHGACQNGHSECVRLLLRHGANPNMESQNGTFPLHHCQKPESYQ